LELIPHGMYIGWGAQGYLDISMGTQGRKG